MRIIKKYANRRLYDLNLSRYITLDDVKILVLDYVEFRVIDAKSKIDLTKSTLLQIISQHEESVTPVFTLEVLQQLIRSYDNHVESLLSQYLEQALRFFMQQRAGQSKYDPNPLDWMNPWLDFQKTLWTNGLDANDAPLNENANVKRKNHR